MRYKCCASEEGMSSRSAEMNTLHLFGSYSGPVMGSFYHSSCRKDQGTVFFFKFGIEDFTDPGLLKTLLTLTGLSQWFCLHKCLGIVLLMIRFLFSPRPMRGLNTFGKTCMLLTKP